MKTLISTRERNRYILQLYLTNTEMDMTDIAQMFGITKQRVSKILGKYKTVRNCSNCFYSQEFGHCSCRATEDIPKSDNKCTDWRP
jgi:hypothetical protein